MAQFTDTQTTANGIVINAVTDTDTNTTTYTVTTPTGQTATNTISSSVNGNNSQNMEALRQQLNAQGFNGFALSPAAVARAGNNVNEQAASAAPGVQETRSIPQNPVNNPGIPEPPGEPPVAVASPVNLDTPTPVDNTQNIIQSNDQDTVLDDIIAGNEQDRVLDEIIQSNEQDTVLDSIIEGNEQDRVLDEIIQSNEQDTILDDIIEGNEQDRVLDDIIQSNNNQKGITAARTNARTAAMNADQNNLEIQRDWRVRLRLAPGIGPNDKYLYKADNPGILAPLASTDGVIFPYVPNISVSYAATYDPLDVVHTNYKTYMYKNSSVDNISIGCEFTAQDTYEANYLLAVIHFFKCVTKMFYGQDQNPSPGTPPPLCYLTGLGAFQFDNHPLAITAFNYTLPTDVDYIRATASTTAIVGVNKSASNLPNATGSSNRLTGGITTGGITPPPTFQYPAGGSVQPTYVPTKMTIQLSAIPIISRNAISNEFSLRDFATGDLLQSNKRKFVGFW